MKAASFCAGVKSELCALNMENCCKWAQCYGMLLFSAQFSPAGIRLTAEHPETMSLMARLLSELLQADASIQARGYASQRTYALTVDDGDDCARIFDAMGHDSRELALRVNRANIESECCAKAFVRGAFLASGFMSDPGKGYHLEIRTAHIAVSRDLATLMRELELPVKLTSRTGVQAVYLKDSGLIEDMLFTMGANATAFDFGGTRVYKDMRNKANRVTNCETANLGKSISAAERHIEAINKLDGLGKLDALPAELRGIARLRLENPYASLSDLGRAMEPPLSKSEVNNRLKRLIRLSEEV